MRSSTKSCLWHICHRRYQREELDVVPAPSLTNFSLRTFFCARPISPIPADDILATTMKRAFEGDGNAAKRFRPDRPDFATPTIHTEDVTMAAESSSTNSFTLLTPDAVEYFCQGIGSDSAMEMGLGDELEDMQSRLALAPPVPPTAPPSPVRARSHTIPAHGFGAGWSADRPHPLAHPKTVEYAQQIPVQQHLSPHSFQYQSPEYYQHPFQHQLTPLMQQTLHPLQQPQPSHPLQSCHPSQPQHPLSALSPGYPPRPAVTPLQPSRVNMYD